MLPEGLPKYTLGWGVLDWCTENLHNPDTAGGDKDAAWVFKPDQIRFVLWFYAVNERGEWIYTQAYRERAKGTGKSPSVAAIACAEFVGPVIFSHFECEAGEFAEAHCDDCIPIGIENEEAAVWLAACSQTGTDHTYGYVLGMLAGPVQENYGLDVGATRVLVPGNSRKILKQVTASPVSLQGPKPSFVIAEETQEWTPGQHGPKLMSRIIMGLSKTQGRYIEVTNAPEPGQNSVAEETHKSWEDIQAGKATDPGLLFDTFMIQVDDVYDAEQAIPALEIMYKDAPWMPPHLTFQRFFNKGLTEVDVRRFYFNETVPPDSMWLDKPTWKKASREVSLKKKDLISLGFRYTKHCAAIVAVRLKDLAIFPIEVWERPTESDRNWEAKWQKVDRAVREALDERNVYNLFASPQGFQDVVGRWYEEYQDEVLVEEFWIRNKQKMADAVELFETGIRTNRFTHNGDKTLSRHIANCFVETVPQGRLIKPITENTTRYIVVAEAAVLAAQAAITAIEDGALDEGPDNYVFSF